MAISLKQAESVIMYGPEQDCVVLVSPPGTGKSSIVSRAARRMGAMYMPVYAATMEAVDARGLPYPEDIKRGAGKRVSWAAPNFLPLEMELERYEGQTVLVNFDDWFQAPPPVLRATVRSIYGDGGVRRIGDFPVFSGARFVATGNREQDRAGVYRPETYVNDRITYLEVEPDVEEWVSGSLNGFAMPTADESYPEKRKAVNAAVGEGVPDELVAFVKWTKQVYDFSSEQRSFLSPRSIERLGRFIRAFEAVGINGSVLTEAACGTIGEAHAVKFLAFKKLKDKLPDVEAILQGKDVPLPPSSEILYILSTTIVRAGRKGQEAAIAKLIQRLAECKAKDGMPVGVEVSAYLFRECLSGANKELLGVRSRPEMMQWVQRYCTYFDV